MKRLQNKRTLITGGTSGIGLETARQFLAEGALVAVTGRNHAGLEAARNLLGNGILAVRSDAASVKDQHELAAFLAREWGQIDALVINAADVTHRPLEDWDEDAYERLMATNLKGPFFLLKHISPLLANPSSVVLCGSVSAHIGLPQSTVYAASKAGLLSLARTLSGEWIKRGIRVNGLSPGPTDTPALEKLGLDPEAQSALLEEIRKLVPLGRLGTVQEIAKAAVFLASDESRYMVGTELLMDGGVGNL